MPSMIFIKGTQKEGGQSTAKGPAKTFVGDVYLDMAYNDEQNTIANVTFTPCARKAIQTIGASSV